MRDASSLDPMWEPDAPRSLRGEALLRGAARVARTVAPFVVTWMQGMKPQLRLSWGATEYHVRRDGIAALRRAGPGFEDNPRSNYNERVQMRQEKAAKASKAQPSEHRSADALAQGVAQSMGAASEATPIRDIDALKTTLAQVRASLQALHDVEDWAAVETLDDEMDKLHRAVEYTMRNHKASEAKSKRDDRVK